MPFLDWVNKNQAVNSAAEAPYHLLYCESVHGDAGAENLLIQGDNLGTTDLFNVVGNA